MELTFNLQADIPGSTKRVRYLRYANASKPFDIVTEECYSCFRVKFEESIMAVHFYLGCPIIRRGAIDFAKEEYFIAVFFYFMYFV